MTSLDMEIFLFQMRETLTIAVCTRVNLFKDGSRVPSCTTDCCITIDNGSCFTLVRHGPYLVGAN